MMEHSTSARGIKTAVIVQLSPSLQEKKQTRSEVNPRTSAALLSLPPSLLMRLSFFFFFLQIPKKPQVCFSRAAQSNSFVGELLHSESKSSHV